MISGAKFSECDRYRYQLWRDWSSDPPPDGRDDWELSTAVFIGLNPSTADAVKNDATVTRCIAHAKRWNCYRMFMMNLFAWRATDPKEMKAQGSPIGPENDFWLLETIRASQIVVACWGNHGSHMQRSGEVKVMLRNAGVSVKCFAVNGTGEPKHPLYVRSDQELMEYSL